MKCGSCETSVSNTDKVLAWVVGLEAALMSEFILMIINHFVELGLPFGLREGASLLFGLIVTGALTVKLKNTPCADCPKNR